MNVPCQVKVPLSLVIKLEALLSEMKKIHEKEVATLAKKMQMAGPSEANVVQQIQLNERSKCLTLNHLLRACIAAGSAALDKKAEDVLAMIATDTVRRGRQSGVRAA